MMEEQRVSSNNNNDSVVVDRISTLPDCILGVILSLLPTKQAVATSLLSKRWKFSWLDVHDLDFTFIHHDAAPDSADYMAFIRFVYRVLFLIGAKPLNTFSLELDRPAGIISSHMICWLDAAIIRNVRAIYLFLNEGETLVLPISAFNCHSLRFLQLSNITFVYDTAVVCLPRLEILQLEGVSFRSNEAFHKLINGCPMLHYLRFSVYKEIDAEVDLMCIVSSSSLRHLDMYFGDRCTLKLIAPSLEYIKLEGLVSEIFVEKSLTSLVQADLDTEFEENDFPCNVIVDALRALEHANFINTTGRFVRALSLATTTLSTKFKRLVKLVVHTDCCCGLQDFVNNFENLEELVICEDTWWPPINVDVPHDHSRWTWTAPVVVPRCLSKSLKRVQFHHYKGLKDEREMIRYMLEHGNALEAMQIHFSSVEDEEQLKLAQQIRDFPRKSVCEVQFDVRPMKRKFLPIHFLSVIC